MSHEFSHAPDHMPLLLQIGKDNRLQGCVARGFKFEEVWLLSDECEELVGEAWGRSGGEGAFWSIPAIKFCIVG